MLAEFEAGVELVGAEVKSLRAGKVSLPEAFAKIENGEAWLCNMHISPYAQASHGAPDPLRRRKLLLHRREIKRLGSQTREKGLTMVPLDIHFRRGKAKVTIALARGRKTRDRREVLKRKAAEREVDRAIRDSDS